MAPKLTQKQIKVLNQLYFKEHNYFGRDKLYKLIQKIDPSISRRQTQDWLLKQEVYQLFRPVRKTKVIRPSVLKKPLNQIGIDLVDMSSFEAKSYHWILTGIDLFSKKAWAVPLKDKTAQTVTHAMKKMIKQIERDSNGLMISSIRSDNGSEFINDRFVNLLKKYNIKQVFSLAGKPQSNGQIERFNGIIKRMIHMYRSQTDDNEWPSYLQTLVDNYNNSYQRVIKANPNDVAFDEAIWDDKHQLIAKNAQRLNHLTPKKANKGDKVRVKVQDMANKYSRQTYRIAKVSKPAKSYTSEFYTLKDHSKPLKEKYYRNDLLVIPSKLKSQVKEPIRFEVSSVSKPVVRHNRQYYKVNWRGYPLSEATFEPRSTLIKDVPKMIKRFEKDHNVVWTKKKVYYD